MILYNGGIRCKVLICETAVLGYFVLRPLSEYREC